MYPVELTRLIDELPAARKAAQDPPELSDKARERLLKEHHPDLQTAAFRHLRVGASRGARGAGDTGKRPVALSVRQCKNGKSRLISSAEGRRPYSQISKASAYSN